MTRKHLFAFTLVFVLAAFYGRRSVRSVFERKPIAGAPIVSLLPTRGAR